VSFITGSCLIIFYTTTVLWPFIQDNPGVPALELAETLTQYSILIAVLVCLMFDCVYYMGFLHFTLYVLCLTTVTREQKTLQSPKL